MVVAGALVLMLGAGFVIVALVVLAWRLQTRRLLRRLRSAPRASGSALAANGLLPRWVLISGTTAAGGAGLLRSPAYDRPCLWFRTDVIEVAEDSVPDEALRHNSRAFFRSSADVPILLKDPTGTVLLDLKLHRAAGAIGAIITILTEEARLSEAHRSGPGTGMERLEQAGVVPRSAYGLIMRRRLDLREELIEPDRPVSVLGRPQRSTGGAIMHTRPGALSPDEPDAGIERLQTETTSDALLLRLFPIGVVLMGVAVVLIAIGLPLKCRIVRCALVMRIHRRGLQDRC